MRFIIFSILYLVISISIFSQDNTDHRNALEFQILNSTYTLQNGNLNEAIVVQQRWGGISSNYTEVTQIGNKNVADVHILGNRNAVRILQENLESELGAGIGNTYRGGITGNSNLVSVAQHGSNNSITQNVTGDSYNYQVTQKGSDNKLELDNLLPTSNPIVIEQNGEGMNLQIDNSFLPVAPGQ